ncbi:hypothetical protein TPHA_0J03150 [Tetrapisispora phaffii CBS 4417]|uniref:Clathrin light chain n=1 Tax=Tetrapisispora phaffii (strain ATCC 24235 / CBS 4417 / NBRC 1672 / NRRL Y-8282 / UCD 70-5) TaxID=1071381 RepID=G8BY83_TETPH|nr:hypothetical protein TPHA_0J03150 [Tetrapisispora phaffii CBS 4417]CCE65134.1 hypothetical protein TPHA_0J03150 [Tetrapisispora phaffii CBS 4417]
MSDEIHQDVPLEQADVVKEFEEQFPDIEDVQPSQVNGEASTAGEQMSGNDAELESGEYTYQEAGEAIRQWKERRDLEITDKDRKDQQEKVELEEDAVKYIDDFYETYNKKKETNLKDVRAENDQFLKSNQEFLDQDNTFWDRVLQLINLDDADQINGRDRSRFKEILQKMKGKTNIPGVN